MGRLHLSTLASTLACTVALLLALVACTDAPEPRVAEPTSDPPTSSPTDATSAPTSSAPTSEPTTAPPADETAAAFIRRWQEAANEMQVSGETKGYQALVLDCESCDNFVANVKRIYAAGGSVQTSGGTVGRIRRWGKVNGWATYDVVVDAAPSTIRSSSAASPDRLPGGRELFRVSIQRAQPWLVRRVTRVV